MAKGKKSSGKRELIAPNKNKRYVRRDEQGQFKESDDQGRSLRQDVKKSAKKKAKPGQGDKGDRPKKKSSGTKKKSSGTKKKSSGTKKKSSGRR